MKFYYQRPTKEIRIVKPDSDSAEYEFWVLVPTRIGSARKVGTQQILTEDSERFANLQSAAFHFLEKHERTVPADKPAVAAAKVQVPGTKIAASGKWAEFCRMRKLSQTAHENITKDYHLSHDELAALGLTGEELQ